MYIWEHLCCSLNKLSVMFSVISCTPVPSLDHIYTFSPNDDHQDVSIEEKYATLMENNSVLEVS